MGRAKKVRKFAQMKRVIQNKAADVANSGKNKSSSSSSDKVSVRNIPKYPAHLFFQHNTSLGPPYHVIIDTNFINEIIQNRLEIVTAMMDCLLAKCIPCITDCVMAELEKLGSKYRIALKIAKDPRFKRLACTHKGTYADDCIWQRAQSHRCYIVGTNDRDLKRRLRKIPGVPILSVYNRKCAIERLPEAYGAVKT